MSSDVVSNPPSSESKSSLKKKAKAKATAVAAPLTQKSTSEVSATSPGNPNGAESTSESPYIKELQKNIRNVNKKLTLMQKVDSIVAENPGVSLDDLVATRKINNDQKAQALKKPALQAQLTQLEEQVSQYKKFDQEYQQKLATEKSLLQSSHKEDLEKLRETLKAEAALEAKKAFKEKCLTLSRFLRAAAARRQLEDDDSDLSKAFEGALLLVYGGDGSAVTAAEKLIEGSEDGVTSTEGAVLSVTYAQIKQAALEEAPFAAEEAWVDDVAQSQAAPPESGETTVPASDPTVVNAGLTELATAAAVNGSAEASDETPSAPPASSIDAGAANAAADEQWDKQASTSDDPLAESFEMVPRDPAETESPAVAAPISSVQSWADDTPETAPTAAPATNGNDGFHEVHHNRGGRGRGGFQEGRGGYRGRGGPRGDRGRGRGRGGEYRPRGRGSYRGGERGGRGDAQ